MGNFTTSCQVSNNSNRNVRVFLTDKALEMDAFIVAAQPGGIDEITAVIPGGKTFVFRKDVDSVRVLASQSQQVPLDKPVVANHFLSAFVEDENDENVCSKQIMHNMSLASVAVTVLLYDV